MEKIFRIKLTGIFILTIGILFSGIVTVGAAHGESFSLIRTFHIESTRDEVNPLSVLNSLDELVIIGVSRHFGEFPIIWDNPNVNVKTESSGYQSDHFITKIDESGNILWSYLFSPTFDDVVYIDIDTNDNIILIGRSASGEFVNNDSYIFDGNEWSGMTVYGDIPDLSSGSRPWVAKLNTDGVISWIRFLDTPDLRFNFIATDGNNDIIILSRPRVSALGNVYTLTKFDTMGNILWDNVTGAGICNCGLIIDDENNIWFLGASSLFDVLLLKYSPDGARILNINLGHMANPNDITIDNANNIYLTGFKNTLFWSGAYSSSGDLLWSTTFSERGTGSAIVIGPDNDVYIAGEVNHDDFPGKNSFDIETDAAPGASDGLLVRLDHENGNFISSAFLGGSGRDTARDISIDSKGNIIVTGSSNSLEFLGESDNIESSMDNDIFVSYIKVSDEYINSSGGASVSVEIFGIFVGIVLLTINRFRRRGLQ